VSRRTTLCTLRALLVGTVLVVAGTACRESKPQQPISLTGQLVKASNPRARLITPVRWDTVLYVGGGQPDTILFFPRLLAAGADMVYAFDYVDGAVKAFDSAGRLRWRSGKRGVGPGEFANPFRVDVGPDSIIWILDAGAHRLTTISNDGTLGHSFSLGKSKLPVTLVPRYHDALVVTASLDPFWFAVDLRGSITASGDVPIPDLADVYPPGRASMAAGAPNGAKWALVFLYGGLLIVYDGIEPRCQGTLVERGPFPRSRGASTIWAAGIAVTDTNVFVLAQGLTNNRLRFIDVYATADCEYERTLTLPRRVSAMAYANGVFYFEYEDSLPTILGLRPSHIEGYAHLSPSHR
jgi:hypothetical protein